MVDFGRDGAVGDEKSSGVSHAYLIEERARIVKAGMNNISQERIGSGGRSAARFDITPSIC
jgi:hypothetical protein